MVKYLTDGTFCQVMDESYSDFDVAQGSYVFIAGSQMVPTDEEDPYIFRRMLIVLPVVDSKVQFNTKPLLINNKHVEEVNEATQEALKEIFEEDLEAIKAEEAENQTTD